MVAEYLTQTIMERHLGTNRLVQLTNDTGAGNVVDTDVLAQCMEDAEAEANMLVNTGFTIPITVAEHGQRAYDTMVMICKRICTYHLSKRRPEILDPDGTIAFDYKEVKKVAEKMAKGGHAMPGEPPVQRSSPEAPSASGRLLVDDSTKPNNRKWARDDTGNM
jgi:phage gp36-like protein